MRRIITYVIFVSGLLLLIRYGGYYQEEMRILEGKTFKILPYTFYSFIYPVIVGLYLALPEFINRLRRVGKLHVNWIKISIIGIPTLLINSSLILYYFTPLDMNPVIKWIVSPHGYDMIGRSLLGAVFGYTILGSISKKSEEMYSKNKKIDFNGL
ncbi:MAG: hypothetical protein APF84_14670 [Gracilibacter sp. BRH_c7a]|nr:MAG: hypothetical protein APF84_14670 [Gracilibacter sp. BRH_c7a]